MKKIVAIVAGGYSGESVISIKSAAIVKKNIDKTKFEPYVVNVLHNKWVAIDDEGQEIAIDKNDFSFKINKKNGSFVFEKKNKIH